VEKVCTVGTHGISFSTLVLSTGVLREEDVKEKAPYLEKGILVDWRVMSDWVRCKEGKTAIRRIYSGIGRAGEMWKQLFYDFFKNSLHSLKFSW